MKALDKLRIRLAFKSKRYQPAMENSSLNASHRYARQAQKLFNSSRFDEAITSHELARKKIEEAMNLTSMPKVLESLRLQMQFHTKQIDLIIIRREQHEKCLAAQAAVDQGIGFRKNLDESRLVQVELFKSLDNVEKVVEVLEQKTLSSGNKEASEFLSKLFEDLKLLNQQSMIMVNRLVTQLDERISENDDLREMVADRSDKLAAQPRTNSLEKKRTSHELSDSDPELHKLEELPPLELPSFDFNTFSSLANTTEDGQGMEGSDDSTKENANLRRIGFSSLEKEEEEEGGVGKKD